MDFALKHLRMTVWPDNGQRADKFRRTVGGANIIEFALNFLHRLAKVARFARPSG